MPVGIKLPEPKKIMLAGDWHGNSPWAKKVIQHAHKQDIDTIVHCGDFGYWTDCWSTEAYMRILQANLEECGIKLYWVDGNHECFDRINEWVEIAEHQPWSDARYPNITHLPRGFRWQWFGKTWLAMGGAHSIDRLQRIEGRSWWDGEHISEADIDRAIMGGPADVMITHDCPFGVNVPGIHADEKLDAEKSFWPLSEIVASNVHRKKLARVVDAVQPSVLIHGHYHCRYRTLRRGDGFITQIEGLDCDGSSLEENTILFNKT